MCWTMRSDRMRQSFCLNASIAAWYSFSHLRMRNTLRLVEVPLYNASNLSRLPRGSSVAAASLVNGWRSCYK